MNITVTAAADRFYLRLVIIAIASASCCSPAQAQIYALPGEDSRPTIAPMLEEVTPAIVNVAVSGTTQLPSTPFFDDPFFRRFFGIPDDSPTIPRQAVGSGVIVDAQKGYVLTNHHVINDADEIVITTLDRRQFEATLVGSDKGTDIALLEIEADGLRAIDFGDSDELRVGDFVAAIGNPFGLGQTVTTGIVSALGRSGLNIEQYENFIQTDAAINIGNSGGALVDFNGELIGINTAIISRGGGNVGISFAIPINMARAIMDQLVTHGVVRRGKLGVFIQTVTPELSTALDLGVTEGALITSVEPDSAAERAGLRPGDVIVSINNDPVTTADQLRNRIGLMRVDDQLRLIFIRDGKTKTARARISELDRGETAAPEDVPQLAGVEFRDMSSDHPLYEEIRGPVISDVASGSPAALTGLQRGDVIAAVNRTRVTSVEELSGAIASTGKPMALDIVRDGARFFIVIR